MLERSAAIVEKEIVVVGLLIVESSEVGRVFRQTLSVLIVDLIGVNWS